MPYLINNMKMLEMVPAVSESIKSHKRAREMKRIRLSFFDLNLSARVDPVGHADERFHWQKEKHS